MNEERKLKREILDNLYRTREYVSLVLDWVRDEYKKPCPSEEVGECKSSYLKYQKNFAENVLERVDNMIDGLIR